MTILLWVIGIWLVGAIIFFHRENDPGFSTFDNVRLALCWPFLAILLFLGWLLHLAGFRIH